MKVKKLEELKMNGVPVKIDQIDVYNWITTLIAHLEEKAGGKVEPRKFDPNGEGIDDIFYFTKCQDILKDDPDGVKPETLKKMWRRKGIMYAALLLRWALGEDLDMKKACQHCGHQYMKFTHLKSGGHAVYCPKCGVTKATVYPETLNGCFENLKDLYFKQFGKELEEAAKELHDALGEAKTFGYNSAKEMEKYTIEEKNTNSMPVINKLNTEVNRLSKDRGISIAEAWSVIYDTYKNNTNEYFLNKGLCPRCQNQLEDFLDEEGHRITYECPNCTYKKHACFISDEECKKLQFEEQLKEKCEHCGAKWEITCHVCGDKVCKKHAMYATDTCNACYCDEQAG